jgi:hypothetical protein
MSVFGRNRLNENTSATYSHVVQGGWGQMKRCPSPRAAGGSATLDPQPLFRHGHFENFLQKPEVLRLTVIGSRTGLAFEGF